MHAAAQVNDRTQKLCSQMKQTHAPHPKRSAAGAVPGVPGLISCGAGPLLVDTGRTRAVRPACTLGLVLPNPGTGQHSLGAHVLPGRRSNCKDILEEVGGCAGPFTGPAGPFPPSGSAGPPQRRVCLRQCVQ